jgi:hypothetical protein
MEKPQKYHTGGRKNSRSLESHRAQEKILYKKSEIRRGKNRNLIKENPKTRNTEAIALGYSEEIVTRQKYKKDYNPITRQKNPPNYSQKKKTKKTK